MTNVVRRAIMGGCCLLVSGASGLGTPAYAQSLPVPTNVESHPAGSGQIILSWDPTTGATSYKIYRSTSAGGEGTTPVATTTTNSYTDTGLTNGPPPVYYYKVAAVNSGGVSGQSAETATPTPYPVSRGSGQVAGVPVGAGSVYYCKDALLNGFDWFTSLNGWFPEVLGSSGASTPTHTVVDMAYAAVGMLAFNNVVVPTSGPYNLDFHYAFAGGLFPSVTNRQMGVQVNGVVITSTMRFPVTGSFETYQDSNIQVMLNAGQNSIVQFAVSDHGVSRVDELTVTPATGSAPTGPTNLTGTPGSGQVSLSWTASSGATAYNVYRGTHSDGEALTPIATLSAATTSYTDTGVTGGKLYFYNVAATNSIGISPDSNEISVTPTSGGGGGGTSGPVSIDCGGGAASPFVADTDFAGGSTSSTTATINTAQLTAPIPPQSVLQTNRHGAMTYTTGGFTAGSSRTVTLYFEELYWSGAGKRVFNVSINGVTVLSNFDIFAAAGGKYIAIQRTFAATANASGQVVVAFTKGTVDNPMVNGISVN
jgi:hypothetical protein